MNGAESTLVREPALSLDQRLTLAMYEIREALEGANLKNSGSYLAAVSKMYATFGRVTAQEYVRLKDKGDKRTAAGRLGGTVDNVIGIMHGYEIPDQIVVFVIKKLEAVKVKGKEG